MQVMAVVFGSAIAHKRTREELDAAIGFERMASDILSTLLAAPRAQHDSVLEAGLRAVAQAFGADRATLWQRVAEQALFTKTHRWLADTAAAPPPDALRTPDLPWLATQLTGGSVVRFSRYAELPAEADSDLEALQALHIGGAVVVPLRLSSGKVAGALSIAHAQEGREWPHALVPRVQLLGEAFASFLARQEAERREVEALAQAAHATRVNAMGVVVASLVHELTQPLAASLANAETVVEQLAHPHGNNDELQATARDIVMDSRRAGELVRKLRRFLRHGEAERIELDLAGLLADVLSFVESEASSRSITLALDVPGVLPRFVGDRVQLEQVLLNLVLNAFDSVAGCDRAARRVTLRARPAKAGLSIEVTDSGTGMDEAALARIFQPFYTTKPGGMGLGLSISQSIVTDHGGTLSVHSEPGRGTTFCVELPSRQPLVIEPVPHTPLPTRTGEAVFVIDDDDATRRAIERQLQAEGYRVESHANAHAFLDRVLRRAPGRPMGAEAASAGDGALAQPMPSDVACIVSDLRMPGLSGLDLQAELTRAKREWPMVFISGQADVPTTAQAMKAGAIAFLTKPFAQAELLAAVADALAISRERDQGRRQLAELLQRLRTLTPREREVFDLVAAGLLNKLVADRLGVAEHTVKIHRGRVMQKMNAGSVADLVRMAERIAAQSAPQPVPHQPPQPAPL
jgi:FixJ family two-component response regulator/signal transduction histidine kinase